MKPKMRWLATVLAFVMIFSLLSPVSLVNADYEPSVEDTGLAGESSQGNEPASTEPGPTDAIPDPTTPTSTEPPAPSEGETIPAPTEGQETEPTDSAEEQPLPEPTLGEEEPLPTEPIEEIITISFDTAGGSPVAPVDIVKGSALSSWPVTMWPYQIFKGWSAIQGGALLTADHDFNESQTIYAVFEPDQNPFGIRNNETGREGSYEVFLDYRAAIPAPMPLAARTLRRGFGIMSLNTIGVDHPSLPGEVMLFKEATLVPGMVNTWYIRLRIEAVDLEQKSDIVLVVDRSASMSGTPMSSAIAAAQSFVNTLVPASGSTTNRVGLVSYNDSVAYPAVIGSTNSQLLTAIGNLTASSYTFTQGGLRQGITALDNSGTWADHKHIVLLSDGVPNRSYSITASAGTRRAGYVNLSSSLAVTGANYARADWSNSTVVGSGADIINTFIENWNSRSVYYNHGNSAINEASFAKAENYTVWTIGYNLASAPDAQAVLDGVASPGHSYSASSADISSVLDLIAGSINSAVKGAQVIDTMADGFQIPTAAISSIAATQGSHSYSGGVLTWNPGTLATPIETGSNIKYAEITYRVEITDDILDETPDDDDLYPTNKDAVLTYQDENNATKTEYFPVPLVNPVFYKIDKVLLDAAGDEVTSESTLNFTVNVTDPTDSGYAATHTIGLPAGSTGLLTTLRHQGTYNFLESAVSNGALGDYDISYTVNGVSAPGKQFIVVDDETADINIVVTNQQKGVVSATGTKVWSGDTLTSRPTVHFKLFRAISGGVAIAVPSAAVKAVVYPATQVSWDNLAERDVNGNVYTYSVREVDASGNDFVPDGYTKTESGLTVTNHRATVSWTPEALKVFNAGGRALADEEFTFELLDSDNNVIGSVKNDATGAIEFHSITYDQDDIGKTFNYKMQEVVPSPGEGGISYDSVPIYITVKVTDGGGLTPVIDVQATGEKDEFVFTNSYSAFVIWQPRIKKELSGRPLAEGDFNFEIRRDGVLLETTFNFADGTVGSPFFYYTEDDIGKTYTYTFKEVIPDPVEPGMTYDPMTITIPVSISDAGGGELVATVNYPDDVTFNNAYHATGTWTPVGQKILHAGGRVLQANEFSFELSRLNTDTGDHDLIGYFGHAADGTINFPTLTFTEADVDKGISFRIREVIPGTPETGMVYDDHTVYVEIYVEHGDPGEVNVTPLYYYINEEEERVIEVDSAEFENTYTAEATWEPLAAKLLTGRPLTAGEFDFQLFKDGTLIETVSNDAASVASFSAITFNQDDIGNTYIFTIKELVPATPEPGMTYETRTITIPVSVSFVDGAFVLDVDEPGDLTLRNIYEASGTWIPRVQKTLLGRPLTYGYFEFALYQGSTLLETKINDGLGNVVFSAITYDQDDVGSTFEYSIKEVIPSPHEFGMTYDTRTFDISVEVTDLGGGVLAATATYPEDTTFVNSYHAEGTWTPVVLKRLVGRTLAAEEFSFDLFKDGAYVETAKNDASGVVTFSAIHYDETDIGVPYVYTIKEVVPATPEGGMTYDPRTISISVETIDDFDGRLRIIPTYPEDVTFVNVYEAGGSWTPEVTKVLTGRDLVDGEFEFSLLEDGNTIQTSTNDATGHVGFVPLHYDASDIGKTFTYKIYEMVPLTPLVGVTYDPREIIITVSISDAGNGVLNVAVDYPEIMTFTNAYHATGAWLPTGTKILSAGGRTLNADEFEFELTRYNTTTDEYDLIGTYGHDASGAISFEALGYDETDVGQPFGYRIREIAGSETGMTYAANVVYVELTVEHGAPGSLVVTPMYYIITEIEPDVWVALDVETAVFENTYEATGEWTPDVHKVLTGRPLADDEFEFFMDVEGAPGIRMAKNKADGTIPFAPITFTADDIGKTYTYWIYEVMPLTPEGGMTYDDMTIVYELTISDAGNGELLITATEPEDTVFNNRYEAADSVVLLVYKVLIGRDLTADEFEFVLLDEDDNVIDTVTNAIDGTVDFNPLLFTEEDIGDVFRYKIREVAGTNAGMTYSTNEVLVYIDVADAGDGDLEISVEYAGERQFYNRYEASGSITPEGFKDFDSWQALVADQFSFELSDADHHVIGIYGHDADGNILFDPLTYTEDDIGETYTYFVREIPGSTPHIHYDPYELSFEVSVADADAGELAISIAYPEAGIVFYNYEDDPLPLIIDPEVEKRVDGSGAPADAPFIFELRALTPGAPMPAGSVGGVLQHTQVGPGSFHFGVIEFPPVAGVYHYEVVEVHGTTTGFTYDETVFTVEAIVTWDEEAHEFVLTTNIEVADHPVENIVFTNHFKPTPPDIPKTGEATSKLPWLGLLLLAGAAFVATIRRKKKAR